MQNLKELQKRADELLSSVESLEDLKNARVELLGRKGAITIFLRSLKDMPLEKRKKVGPRANELKEGVARAVEHREQELKKEAFKQKMQDEKIDVTRPGTRPAHGSLHPLTQVEHQLTDIFTRLGFAVAEGPHIETEYYNFDALNIPAGHPARDMHDTFWLRQPAVNKKDPKKHLLMRTHTSPVQVHYMEKHMLPLRIIVPGSVFRYEALDATHSFQFAQAEGLLVDKEVSVANFKAVIEEFLSEFFGGDVEVRLRPSYFPFVEPGFEVDAFYNGSWIELLGAGMVHPNVFASAGYNPDEWQGFAFGVGIDRLAMVKYQIDDIRLFYENDIRFLEQF